MVRWVIFDFDGLIVDTELPDFQTWQEVYAEHGCTLPRSVWTPSIGTAGAAERHSHGERLGRAPGVVVVTRQQQRGARIGW